MKKNFWWKIINPLHSLPWRIWPIPELFVENIFDSGQVCAIWKTWGVSAVFYKNSNLHLCRQYLLHQPLHQWYTFFKVKVIACETALLCASIEHSVILYSWWNFHNVSVLACFFLDDICCQCLQIAKFFKQLPGRNKCLIKSHTEWVDLILGNYLDNMNNMLFSSDNDCCHKINSDSFSYWHEQEEVLEICKFCLSHCVL